MSGVEWVAGQLVALEGAVGDFEVAHMIEDGLMLGALHLIAQGCEDPTEVARLAATAADVKFDRWYA